MTSFLDFHEIEIESRDYLAALTLAVNYLKRFNSRNPQRTNGLVAVHLSNGQVNRVDEVYEPISIIQ
jgi:hypothetical protein